MGDRTRAGRGRTRPRIFIGGLACLGGFLAGCGGERFPSITTYPVQGKVLLVNGKPLGVGRIYFLPMDAPPLRASGELGADGSFRLTTREPEDGTIPGRYRVRIDPTPKDPSAVPRSEIPRIPAKYTDEDGSADLIVTVKAEPYELEPFRLK